MGIYKKKNSDVWMMTKCINGIKYAKSSTTPLKTEAKYLYDKWASELQEAVRNGNKPVKQVKILVSNSIKPITFYELAEQYLAYANGRLKSYGNLKYFVKTLLKKFGNVKLNDFNLIMLEKLQSDMLSQDFSISYANRLTATVKAMFTKAYQWELASEEILKKVRMVKLIKGEKERTRYLSEEESERLIVNCDNYLKPIVICALNSGMRKGEILNLKWDRLDLLNRVISIDNDKTKNGKSRKIPINDTLYETVSAVSKVRRINVPYVFYNPDTLKPFIDIKKGFGSALKKSHITDFRFHDLRHTFASRLVMGGVDLVTVRDLMGHKDIKMTLRYSHLSNSHLIEGVKVLDSKKFTTNLLPQTETVKQESL
ncbi:MAG: site-specific integrase [bacterium]